MRGMVKLYKLGSNSKRPFVVEKIGSASGMRISPNFVIDAIDEMKIVISGILL